MNMPEKENMTAGIIVFSLIIVLLIIVNVALQGARVVVEKIFDSLLAGTFIAIAIAGLYKLGKMKQQ